MTPSADLQTEIRRVFEPKYGRPLSDDAAEEISCNLLAFAEAVLGGDQGQKRRLGDWGAVGTNKCVGGLDE